jgi:hypothetical protein
MFNGRFVEWMLLGFPLRVLLVSRSTLQVMADFASTIDVPPADAYVAVRYRGMQFWIDDRDLRSKSSMSFLMLIFSLAETGALPGTAAPVVTVPAR